MVIARVGMVGLALAMILALLPFSVRADQDPVGCSATGVGLSLTVYRSDGITPVGGGDALPGETLKYASTLSHLGPPNCNYEQGTLTIMTPDGVVTDVTGGGIPLIQFGLPFTSPQVSYVVSNGDVGGDGDLDASSNYTNGIAHAGNDNTIVSASTQIATNFAKLDPLASTEVHNDAHADITNGIIAQGENVHDEVTVTGNGPTPTGTVDFTLYDNLTCDGTVVDSDLGVALVSGVAESSVQGALSNGGYSYLVNYSGDDNYNEASAECEPFTVVTSLVVEKTAVATYDRKWDWTIDKSSDQTSLLLADGESFTVNYQVEVGATSQVVNAMVNGTITITNPEGNPSATVTGVSDLLSNDGAATVDCSPEALPKVLAAGESLVCTYSKNTSGATDQTNTATVTTSGPVPGNSDQAAVDFGDNPTSEIDECIDVSDNNVNGGSLGTVCADDVDKTFNYSVTFGPQGGQGVDVPVTCGEIDHPNVASFVTTDDANDTDAAGQDNWSVHVNVNCPTGCTLTQGYWKTHNESFGGGAPADDNWLNIGDWDNDLSEEAENEDLIPGYSWFDVFATPPKGGNVWYQLAHQWMAAYLNMLNGADTPPAVDTALTNGLTWLQTHSPLAKIKGKDATDAHGWATTLGSYNEGLIGPGHCDEETL